MSRWGSASASGESAFGMDGDTAGESEQVLLVWEAELTRKQAGRSEDEGSECWEDLGDRVGDVQ